MCVSVFICTCVGSSVWNTSRCSTPGADGMWHVLCLCCSGRVLIRMTFFMYRKHSTVSPKTPKPSEPIVSVSCVLWWQWWNVRGCPNQQMNENTTEQAGQSKVWKGIAILQVSLIQIVQISSLDYSYRRRRYQMFIQK